MNKDLEQKIRSVFNHIIDDGFGSNKGEYGDAAYASTQIRSGSSKYNSEKYLLAQEFTDYSKEILDIYIDLAEHENGNKTITETINANTSLTPAQKHRLHYAVECAEGARVGNLVSDEVKVDSIEQHGKLDPEQPALFQPIK